MISLIIIIASVLFAIGYAISIRKKIKQRQSLKSLLPTLIIFIVGVIVGLIQPYTLERVDAGYIGIKVNLAGSERGVSDYTYKTGWVVYNEWTEQLYEFPTFQQHIEYDTTTVITKGGFVTTITPTFNYATVPDAVGDMFVNLRISIKEVEQGWMKTAIVGSVMDVANRWTVDSIFNFREKFEHEIVNECNKRISKWFNVSQLRTNIMPPLSLVKAIEDKTKAIQEVQVAENLKQVAIANGLRLIAVAKADSAQKIIKANADAQSEIISAKGTAEAMRLKQQQLSSLYVEFIKAQAWDGKMPTTVLGNSTPMINIK